MVRIRVSALPSGVCSDCVILFLTLPAARDYISSGKEINFAYVKKNTRQTSSHVLMTVE